MTKNAFKNARKKLLEAGHIAAKAIKHTCQLIKPDKSLLAIVERGEQQIRKLGGTPAFPVNISINHFAAHYTPGYRDVQRIPKSALVKVDLGVHVDGYIADTATTVITGDIPQLKQLCKASDAGLQAAIATIRSGIRVWDVSKAIAKAMHQLSVQPITNLTGHSVEQFNLHAGLSIPAVAHPIERSVSPRLKEKMVLAIEPFATYSQHPTVVDLQRGHIYGFVQGRNPGKAAQRTLFSQMKISFSQLPFASRWMKQLIPEDQIKETLEKLEKEKVIHNYPVLGLQDEQFVAQSEHTVIVERGGCTITTLLPEDVEES